MPRKKMKPGDWIAMPVHATSDGALEIREAEAVILPASPATLAKWYRMLPGILKQLEAMNCSSAHAASWCEPRSQLTTNLIKRIRRIAKGQRKAKGGRGK